MRIKKRIIGSLLLVFTIGFVYLSINKNSTEIINIGSFDYREKNYNYNRYEKELVPDRALRDVIKEIIFNQFNETEITQENLRKIKFIDAEECSIKSIKGLELCENLIKLNLNKNSIKDITPLENLNMLKEINLQEQKLFIDLKVKDKKALEKNSSVLEESLKNISLEKNDKIDINTKKLKKGVKSGENIQIKFKGDKGLEGTLNLKLILFTEEALIKDVNLEEEIKKNLNKKDLLTIKDLEKIKSLNLNNKNITYLDGLENCINLEELTLVSNNISDITSLWNLKNLKVLNLRDNKIENINSLENLKEILFLDLGFNNIREIDKLEKLNKVEELDLSNNRIREIKIVENMGDLKKLNLSNNNIINTTSLEKLANVEILNLNGNSIIDLSKLKKFTEIKTLDIENQKINMDIGIKGIEKNDEVLIKNIFKGVDGNSIVPEIKSEYYSILEKEKGYLAIKILKEVEEYKNYKASFNFKEENVIFSGELAICFRDKQEQLTIVFLVPIMIIGILLLTRDKEKLSK